MTHSMSQVHQKYRALGRADKGSDPWGVWLTQECDTLHNDDQPNTREVTCGLLELSLPAGMWQKALYIHTIRYTWMYMYMYLRFYSHLLHVNLCPPNQPTLPFQPSFFLVLSAQTSLSLQLKLSISVLYQLACPADQLSFPPCTKNKYWISRTRHTLLRHNPTAR